MNKKQRLWHTILILYIRSISSLRKKQCQQLLAALQSQGIDILKIEAYEYTDAPGIKHLFFYFAEDSRKAIPYFMLDCEIWEKIILSIMTDVWEKNILICQTDLKNHILTKSHKTGILFVEKDIGTIRHQWIAAKLDLRVTGKPLNLLQ